MATETKSTYGKYFIEYDPTRWPKERRPVMVRMEDSVMKGSHFYLVHWVLPGFEAPLGNYPMAGHPLHIHKDAELLFHIGTDPSNPWTLGLRSRCTWAKSWKGTSSQGRR